MLILFFKSIVKKIMLDDKNVFFKKKCFFIIIVNGYYLRIMVYLRFDKFLYSFVLVFNWDNLKVIIVFIINKVGYKNLIFENSLFILYKNFWYSKRYWFLDFFGFFGYIKLFV